jgi:hypothetical protein
MGYTLRALVGQPASFRPLLQVFPQAVLVDLAQGLSLLPLSDELLDELTGGRPSDVLPPFYYLTHQLEVYASPNRGPVVSRERCNFHYLTTEK